MRSLNPPPITLWATGFDAILTQIATYLYTEHSGIRIRINGMNALWHSPGMNAVWHSPGMRSPVWRSLGVQGIKIHYFLSCASL